MKKENYIYTKKENTEVLIKILSISDNFFAFNLKINSKDYKYNQSIIFRNINFEIKGTKILVSFKKNGIFITLKKLIFSLTLQILKIIDTKIYIKIDGKFFSLVNKLLKPILKILGSSEEIYMEDDILVIDIKNFIEDFDFEEYKIQIDFV